MNRTNALAKHLLILSLLLLLGSDQQVNGQQKEPRKLFLIDDNTAFIDISGTVVINASQPLLLEEVRRVSAKIGSFWGREIESSGIRFGEFSEGLAVVGWALCPMCRNPHWVNGIIDGTGRMVIPPTPSYTRLGSFHEGLAQYHGRGVGFIDRAGRIRIPARFDEASDFSEGLAFVRPLVPFPLQEKSKFGFIDRQGKLVIPYRFEWVSGFHDGLAAVQLSKGKYGFIDKTGKVILYAKEWFEVDDFSEGLACVKVKVTDNTVYRGYQEERYGYINRTGKIVIAPRFYRALKFSEGRALLIQTGQKHGYGFIDSNGQVVIKPEFVDAKSFSEGLAAVAIRSSDEKKIWGYINREGQWVIKPQFQNVNSFNGGLAAVKCREYGTYCKAYIDTVGKIVWQKL